MDAVKFIFFIIVVLPFAVKLAHHFSKDAGVVGIVIFPLVFFGLVIPIAKILKL